MAITDDQANVLRRIATAVLLLALFSPLVRNQDGLPLSTYPMYASTRGEVLQIIVAYGVAMDGSQIDLSMPQIASTRDPLIAQSFLNDAVAAGTVNELCAEIAARANRDTAFVEVAREERNTVDHVADRPSLIERTVIARCER